MISGHKASIVRWSAHGSPWSHLAWALEKIAEWQRHQENVHSCILSVENILARCPQDEPVSETRYYQTCRENRDSEYSIGWVVVVNDRVLEPVARVLRSRIFLSGSVGCVSVGWCIIPQFWHCLMVSWAVFSKSWKLRKRLEEWIFQSSSGRQSGNSLSRLKRNSLGRWGAKSGL